MKNMVKRIGVLLAIITLMFSGYSKVEAAETSGYNVTKINLYSGISTDGLGKPDKGTCVNLTSEALTFTGEANVSVLYTNSCFTGKENPLYQIRNYSDSDLKVKVYKSGSLFAVCTITVKAHTLQGGNLSGVSDSDIYYISFSAPSNFSGRVY